MLLAFRRFGQTTVVKYGLLLLALSFVTWGIGDYLNGGYNTTAIKVGDGEISSNDLYQSYQQRKNQFSQMAGQTITDDMAKQIGLPNLIISEQVRQKLLENNANQLGLVGSDLEIARQIQTMNTFQEDGEFNANLYRQNLQLSGMTARNFEDNLKKEQQQNALRALFRPKTPKDWLTQQTQLNNSVFDITLWPINEKSLPPLAEPTQIELREFYTARAAQYQLPESRDLNILSINSENFMPKTNPSDAQIEAYYTENLLQFTPEEKRIVQQVISPNKATAESVRKQLIAGEALNNAVKLGTVAAADLPENFAQAVFSLDVNSYSKPLETPFGYAIAWVTDIQKSLPKPLSKARLDIITELKKEQAILAFENVLETIEDSAAGGTPLSQIAKEFELTVKKFNTITLNTDKIDAEILSTAFELRENEISEAIENTEKDNLETFTFVEVKAITPPTLPAINTQLDRVLIDFTTARNQERIRSAITIARSEMSAGKPISAAFKVANLSPKPVILKDQKKTDINEMGWPSNTFNQLLSLNAGQTLQQNLTYQNSIALLQLKKRTQGAATKENIAINEKILNNTLRDELFLSYLKVQEAKQKVKLYDSRLQQVFNSGEYQ